VAQVSVRVLVRCRVPQDRGSLVLVLPDDLRGVLRDECQKVSLDARWVVQQDVGTQVYCQSVFPVSWFQVDHLMRRQGVQ
jgi:hypothetical protein